MPAIEKRNNPMTEVTPKDVREAAQQLREQLELDIALNTKPPKSAAERRADAERKLAKLRKVWDKLVKQSLTYEPGEIVMIPHFNGPVVMEIVKKAKGYGEYKVRLQEDGRIITQSARYFEPYDPTNTK